MDAGDVTPSIMLFFDHRRFLFNVGEGFQRYCVEHGVRPREGMEKKKVESSGDDD